MVQLNKGPKKFQSQNEKSIQQNDTTNKNKCKKTDRYCNFCNRDGLLESKFFKQMEAFEVAMKKKASIWSTLQLQLHLQE